MAMSFKSKWKFKKGPSTYVKGAYKTAKMKWKK